MDSAGDKRGRDDVDDKPNKRDVIPVPRLKITHEQLHDYFRRRQHFGYRGSSLPGGIGPYEILDEDDKQHLTDLAKRCLQVYNNQNKGTFEFHELLNVESQAVAGLMFYITFTARSADNAFETFYGTAWDKVDKTIDVTFCGIATKQETGTSQKAGTSQV